MYSVLNISAPCTMKFLRTGKNIAALKGKNYLPRQVLIDAVHMVLFVYTSVPPLTDRSENMTARFLLPSPLLKTSETLSVLLANTTSRGE